MILSSDELEILDYLKSWKDTFVSMIEVCRCAGGRKKFRECPHWAKGLMARLVDERLVEVNERGHYRYIPEKAAPQEEENYFASSDEQLIVGDNYFSPSEPASEAKNEADDDHHGRWISPHIETILKKAGKKIGKANHGQ